MGSSKPKYLPKATSPNTITLGLGPQHRTFRGTVQSKVPYFSRRGKRGTNHKHIIRETRMNLWGWGGSGETGMNLPFSLYKHRNTDINVCIQHVCLHIYSLALSTNSAWRSTTSTDERLWGPDLGLCPKRNQGSTEEWPLLGFRAASA